MSCNDSSNVSLLPVYYTDLTPSLIDDSFPLLNRHAPVSIAAKFDTSDNLLSAVDIKFDCEILLNSMVSCLKSDII